MSQSGDDDAGVLPVWHVSGPDECLDSNTVATKQLNKTMDNFALLSILMERTACCQMVILAEYLAQLVLSTLSI